MAQLLMVPGELLPIVQEIYRFLLEFEEDRRIEVNVPPPHSAWFSVTSKRHRGKVKEGERRVRGDIDSYRFSLFITRKMSACFETEDKHVDIEHLLYLFIDLIDQYRINLKLPQLDTHIIHGLAVEDSPPISPEHYEEVPLVQHKALQGLIPLLIMNFANRSLTERHGRFCYFICSEVCAEGSPPLMEPQYVPVYQELMGSFKTAFAVNYVQLLAIRWACKQRLFFIADLKHFYCCKTDGSLEFLKKYADYIGKTISISPSGLLRNPKRMRKQVEKQVTGNE
jgi:hypothetical protein